MVRDVKYDASSHEMEIEVVSAKRSASEILEYLAPNLSEKRCRLIHSSVHNGRPDFDRVGPTTMKTFPSSSLETADPEFLRLAKLEPEDLSAQPHGAEIAIDDC